jgi:hypothetical protein
MQAASPSNGIQRQPTATNTQETQAVAITQPESGGDARRVAPVALHAFLFLVIAHSLRLGGWTDSMNGMKKYDSG